MNNDLNRSLRMLEESLASPGSSKLKERNKNRYADLSVTLAPHELRQLMERDESLPNTKILLTGSSKPKERNKSKLVDLSISLAPHELRHLMEIDTLGHTSYTSPFSTYLEGDKTIAGSILRANEPWKSTANSLYNEFYETLQAHSNGHEVFEVISDLARCCSDALQVIQGLKTKVSKEDDGEYVWLENEKNTWRLLYVLYQDRLSSLNVNKDEQIGGSYFGTSEKLCVSHLFKVDHLLRESQLVIDWLEYSAAERDNETLHFADMTVGWENTLHQLQSAETIVFESSRKIVSSLHPDAPHREKLPLHDLDMEDEARLCRRMFQEIRCGKLEQAKALCINCGHAWRAALLEGWRLFHNPNLSYDIALDECMDTDLVDKETSIREIMKEEDLQVTEGNANRDIWKKMAYLYCQKPYLNVYEKAAVAAYCGHLQALLSICNNWEDNLWAYMRVLVDIRVESEIRDSIDKLYQQLPEEYWDQKMSLNKVFSCLEASENPIVRAQAQMPDYIIQKYVILDEIPKLMEALNEWAEDPTTTSQSLRFVAHLVLFLELIGQSCQKDVTEKVLQAYVYRLMEMNETPLVAYYVGKLGPDKQVQVFASYLERILDNEERKDALTYAEDSGLNTKAITKQVVENIRSRPHEVGDFGDLQQRMTDSDMLKISAIDWLLIYESQRLEALEQTNALIFTFLTLNKLDAAQLAFNKIPTDTVEHILAEGELLPEVDQIIREYFSYKAYLDAHEAFSAWYKQFNSKPIPPENLPDNASFTEKVAHQHRESQFRAETERWKLTTTHLAKIAKSKLYNVLLFPDGGWLSGAKDGEFLRSSCIPEITLLLFSVLHESGNYEECVQLADILAAEKYGLYKAFSKEKLGNVLMTLCESSVALLNEQKDPWGNITTE